MAFRNLNQIAGKIRTPTSLVAESIAPVKADNNHFFFLANQKELTSKSKNILSEYTLAKKNEVGKAKANLTAHLAVLSEKSDFTILKRVVRARKKATLDIISPAKNCLRLNNSPPKEMTLMNSG